MDKYIIKTKKNDEEEREVRQQDAAEEYGSPNTTSQVIQDLSDSDAETKARRTNKRKKISSPNQEKDEGTNNLKKLKEKIEELARFAGENKTVHNEIKILITEANGLVKRTLNETTFDSVRLTALQEEFKEYKLKQEMNTKRLEEELKNLREKFVDNGTLKTGKRRPGLELTEFRDFSRVEKTFPVFKEIVTQRWPKENLEKIKVTRGNAFSSEMEDVVYFMEEGKDTANDEISSKILERYPELSEAEKIPCKGGKRSILEIITRYGKIEKQRIISALYHDGSKEKLLENFFGLCQEIKKDAVDKSNGVIFVAPTGLKTYVVVKMLAFIFFEAGIKITLKIADKSDKTPMKSKIVENDTIIIENESTSYAETLKKIKDGLEQDEKNTIKTVRKARNGNIIIKTQKGSKNNITHSLKRVMDGESCKIREAARRIIHLSGLDPTAEENDILEALRNCGIKFSEQVVVKSLRPTKNGAQIATILLSGADAKSLVEGVKKLRVGLCVCNVWERVDILTCYRCWSYGHKAHHCQGEDRTHKCRRCAEDGHIAKNCKGEEFCPHCNVAGHTAGTSKCILFKKALNEAKRKHTAKNV